MAIDFKKLEDPNEALRIATQLAQMFPAPDPNVPPELFIQALKQMQQGGGQPQAQAAGPAQPQAPPAQAPAQAPQPFGSTQGVNPILAQLMQGAR